MIDFERNYTMGKLIWLGWAMTWEDVRRANNRTSIMMGNHIVKNTRPLSRDEHSAKLNTTQDAVDDEVSTSTTENAEQPDAPDSRRFEVSFPIAPTSSDKQNQSGE